MSYLLQRAVFACVCAAYSQSIWAEVVINEIHVDPPVKTELVEFIELHNTGPAEVDIAGWSFSRGITFTFPVGTRIAPGGYLVVAQNPAHLQAKFGITSVGPWEGLLSNEGERITLVNAAGEEMDDVDYGLGFPWPTVGDQPGYSMELVNPAFDNDLGGSWRVSVRDANPNTETQILIDPQSLWKYREGTQEASSPATAWRQPSYNDNSWPEGPAPFGYDPSLSMGTPLDMRDNYTSLFLRKEFNVDDLSQIGSLKLYAMYDDGFKVWINGQPALSVNISSGEVPYNGTAGPARESSVFEEFLVPPGLLVQGQNTIAIQLHNAHISNSSDCYIDIRLEAELGAAGAGPTPGALNAVFDTNLPPHLRQVDHSPKQPRGGEPVTITIKATDPDGVQSLELLYQIVNPGSYVELNDAAYEANWTSLPMRDDGAGGDALAGDSIYTAVIPGTVQQHRRLVRYRINATDSGGRGIRAPYLDDPVPNFAYFVYNDVPAWQGAVQPGAGGTQGQVVTYPGAEMERLPVYHLVAKRTSVEDATWNSRYTGDEYRWWGTLVYDGEVYDHIRYRARGGVWRYAMGKNMWKFDFNRGHDFQARDNYGREYDTTWRKLNLGANIQQGNFGHRGEQGMFESVGFRLFNLAGVESPKTHWISFRVVDEASESGTTQYNSDFWGLYLAIEQEDGRFLDEHSLPDGNLYKMESYTGELNNQGRTAATDKSDLNTFLNTYRNTTPSLQWWRQNLHAEKYFSYQAIVQGIHHYDICDGKNYFYYLNPETGRWSVHSWDLDLTWANNMYRDCAGSDDLKNRVLANATLALEHKNRLREIRDLLFNNDQAFKLLDEYAGIVKGPNTVNILGADRSMWDYNPIMVSGLVNSGKAGHGLFYQFPYESGGSDPSVHGTFDAGVQIMKDYVVERSAFIDGLAQDNAIPAKPTLTYTGPANYPLNKISVRSSNYSGQNSFAAMEWRVGEVRTAAPGVPGIYEIEPLWESGELTQFNNEITIPANAFRVGHEYRARVRFKDSTGRWSHWSEPVQFLAAEPDNATALQQNLRITELMYNPTAGSDYEYIEILNTSTEATLQLDGVAFTSGADFVFPAGSTLGPGQYALVTKFTAATADPFRQEYGLSSEVPIFGPVSGNLNNDGERITLKTALAGAELISFAYNDRAGWPISPDGTGHSLVPLESTLATQGQGPLEYGGNWRASAYLSGSPGAVDPVLPALVLINEISAHTDYSNPSRPEYDSNDWIELVSPASAATLQHYFLSDSASDLRKWAIPETVIPSGGRVSFDEVSGFHNPVTTGFGLNKAGEEVFLSHLPPGGPERVVDAVRFKGQASDTGWGRYPDGGTYFYTTAPTRDGANVPIHPELVISEFLYHAEDDALGTEPAWQEFVEIYNPGSSSVPLFNANSGFRMDGGISLVFSNNVSIPARSAILLVTFDPADAAQANQFRQFYGIGNTPLYGPYSGRLSNSSDRLAIEKPEAPDAIGEPLVWVIVDEAIYLDQAPWPNADGNGQSLTRTSFTVTGNDPSNWTATTPTPGAVESTNPDRDGDGMPNDWETAHGLDPDNPADAAIDPDTDGLTNLEEFLAGTDPQDPSSALALTVEPLDAATAELIFTAAPGKTYSILATDDPVNGTWTKLQDVSGEAGPLSIQVDIVATGQFYQIVTPAIP